ncbi:hypothetical protein CTAYLR_007878 [Chrysophaeum taylorii]|uniref:Uncharacterized protein n=1 Tax=Chrysophaeum taylorii TaxID=2483200 RepID=A0AAD7XQR5_9STRA|nr:hypothetical protein CTAYLR_007878 [Chrysophaeum taylorii]
MAASNEYDFLFKILMIGDSGCGKSSLLLRWADHEFKSEFICTIGVDFKIRTMDLEGKIAKLQIWDTAGQERFKTITNSYYHGAQGVMIVFDLTSHDSFEHVSAWLSEVQRHSPKTVRVMLCGNKSDLASRREVTVEEAVEFADRHGLHYIETSAKLDHNVHSAFTKMATTLREQRILIESEQRKRGHRALRLEGRKLDNPDENPGGWCC